MTPSGRLALRRLALVLGGPTTGLPFSSLTVSATSTVPAAKSTRSGACCQLADAKPAAGADEPQRPLGRVDLVGQVGDLGRVE
jgi:hypothetical protein